MPPELLSMLLAQTMGGAGQPPRRRRRDQEQQFIEPVTGPFGGLRTGLQTIRKVREAMAPPLGTTELLESLGVQAGTLPPAPAGPGLQISPEFGGPTRRGRPRAPVADTRAMAAEAGWLPVRTLRGMQPGLEWAARGGMAQTGPRPPSVIPPAGPQGLAEAMQRAQLGQMGAETTATRAATEQIGRRPGQMDLIMQILEAPNVAAMLPPELLQALIQALAGEVGISAPVE